MLFEFEETKYNMIFVTKHAVPIRTNLYVPLELSDSIKIPQQYSSRSNKKIIFVIENPLTISKKGLLHKTKRNTSTVLTTNFLILFHCCILIFNAKSTCRYHQRDAPLFFQFQALFKQFFHSQQTNSVNEENTTEVVVNLLETKGYADQDAHAYITTYH